MLAPAVQQQVDRLHGGGLDVLALGGHRRRLRAEPLMPAAAISGRDLEVIGRIDFGAMRQQRLDRDIIEAQRRDHQRPGAAAHHVVLEATAAVAVGAHAREFMVRIHAHGEQPVDHIHRRGLVLRGAAAVAPG